MSSSSPISITSRISPSSASSPALQATRSIVAMAQYFLDPKTQAAEVAFVVHDEWQQKGMGTYLLDYIT